MEHKLFLTISLHSVCIDFQQTAVTVVKPLPAVLVRICSGSAATQSVPAGLRKEPGKSSTYRASWINSSLPLNLTVSQDATSGLFHRKKVKIQLKIHGQVSHKSLASCKYDVSSLNLSRKLESAEDASETRLIPLSTRSAAGRAAAIHGVTVKLTFCHQILPIRRDTCLNVTNDLPQFFHAPTFSTCRNNVNSMIAEKHQPLSKGGLSSSLTKEQLLSQVAAPTIIDSQSHQGEGSAKSPVGDTRVIVCETEWGEKPKTGSSLLIKTSDREVDECGTHTRITNEKKSPTRTENQKQSSVERSKYELTSSSDYKNNQGHYGSCAHVRTRFSKNTSEINSSSVIGYGNHNTSISDLIKPTACASLPGSDTDIEQECGVLKLCLKALNISNAVFDKVYKQGEAKEGLYCVFTIGGGSSRFVSSIQQYVPDMITKWDTNEEIVFYVTSQTKKLFILCWKTSFEDAAGNTRINNSERCVGAAALEIKTVKSHSTSLFGDLADVKYEHVQLPVEPKGSILLQSCLCVLKPRLKVTCKGALQIQSLSKVYCKSDCNIFCTVKIDSKFQGDTEPQSLDTCAVSGWSDTIVEFEACGNKDCSIAIWTYSSKNKEEWCGGCVFPLGMLVSDNDIQQQAASHKGFECVVSTQNNKTITVPVEPKGVITLSYTVVPSVSSHGYTSLQPGDFEGRKVASDPAILNSPNEVHSTSLVETNVDSLKRTTIKNSGDFNLKVLKSYKEEPLQCCFDIQGYNHEQSVFDIKTEVEFLREELRQTKAKLAESEFYREQAELKLKYKEK